jgi:hypothetical protein
MYAGIVKPAAVAVLISGSLAAAQFCAVAVFSAEMAAPAGRICRLSHSDRRPVVVIVTVGKIESALFLAHRNRPPPRTSSQRQFVFSAMFSGGGFVNFVT